MFAQATTAALVGLESLPVTITARAEPSPAGFQIAGLSEAAARESRVRVNCALARFGIEIDRSVLVNVQAPAGASAIGFDVAIACAVAAAFGKIDPARLAETVLLGELSLAGQLRPVRGVICHLATCAAKRVIVPHANAREAGCAARDTYAVSDLAQALACLRGSLTPIAALTEVPHCKAHVSDAPPALLDMARELIASPARRVLLVGAPGSGRTVLARAIANALPELNDDELPDTLKIRSAAGLLQDDPSAWRARPFRAPHHSVSEAGLIGGGTSPRPGEVSLAHHGVLFLDEIHEFRRSASDAAFTALAAGRSNLAAGGRVVSFPARPAFVIATAPPCPCGYLGHPRRACACAPALRQSYAERRLAPLARMFDRTVEIAS